MLSFDVYGDSDKMDQFKRSRMERWAAPLRPMISMGGMPTPIQSFHILCLISHKILQAVWGSSHLYRGSIMRGQQLFGEANGIMLWLTSSSPLFPALTRGGHVLQEAMARHGVLSPSPPSPSQLFFFFSLLICFFFLSFNHGVGLRVTWYTWPMVKLHMGATHAFYGAYALCALSLAWHYRAAVLLGYKHIFSWNRNNRMMTIFIFIQRFRSIEISDMYLFNQSCHSYCRTKGQPSRHQYSANIPWKKRLWKNCLNFISYLLQALM